MKKFEIIVQNPEYDYVTKKDTDRRTAQYLSEDDI